MANSDMCLEAARKAFPDNEELRVAYMLGFNEGYDKATEQLSLPSNLDEAAEKYANTHYGEFVEVEYEFSDPIETLVDDKPFVHDAFKAGAKWMAGQGVSMLGKVGIYGVDVESITKELREAGFNLGEEIILQIRKK